MDSAHFKGYVYVKIFYSANLCNGIVFLETFSDVSPRRTEITPLIRSDRFYKTAPIPPTPILLEYLLKKLGKVT